MLFLPLVDVFGDAAVLELFSEKSLVEAWLEVERALAAAQAGLGIVPAGAAASIAAEATADKIDVDRLREQTRVVGYPILPLLEQIRAASSPEVARYLHWGATTQDVMDTGLALTLRRALERVEALTLELGGTIAAKADQHRQTVMVGRTHARPAVPITLGAKLAVWLAELARHLDRLRAARRRGPPPHSAPRAARSGGASPSCCRSGSSASPGTPRATVWPRSGSSSPQSPRRAARSAAR
jgi:3-carboxy-cis,cis-muconate cycloisomerase